MPVPPLNDINPRMTTPPPGLEFASFINGDRAHLRYATVPPAVNSPQGGKALGVAFVVTGFRESLERYYELMHDLTERGYAVYAMDWRGQGGSQRYRPKQPQRPNAQGYEHDAADLNQFITDIVQPDHRHLGLPKILFAHSMGGNIALRYLHDYPGDIDAAVITSPMLEIKTRWMPPWVARQISRVADMIGAGDRYISTRGDFHENELKHLKEIASDRSIRQHLHLLFYRDMPEQRLGKPTFGWMRAAFRSMAVLRDPEYLKAIKTPILLASAGQDRLVTPRAINRAARFLPKTTLSHFKTGLHSLWAEENEIRDRLWQDADLFLHRTVGTPLPKIVPWLRRQMQFDGRGPATSNLTDRRASRQHLASGPNAATPNIKPAETQPSAAFTPDPRYERRTRQTLETRRFRQVMR